MPDLKKLKKSESLEIRIPYPTKQAFMARCRDDGRSASEALRALIEGQLAEPRQRSAHRRRNLMVGALIAAAVGAAAVPSLARVAIPGQRQAEFQRLDADHDGRLTLGEYRARAN